MLQAGASHYSRKGHFADSASCRLPLQYASVRVQRMAPVTLPMRMPRHSPHAAAKKRPMFVSVTLPVRLEYRLCRSARAACRRMTVHHVTKRAPLPLVMSIFCTSGLVTFGCFSDLRGRSGLLPAYLSQSHADTNLFSAAHARNGMQALTHVTLATANQTPRALTRYDFAEARADAMNRSKLRRTASPVISAQHRTQTARDVCKFLVNKLGENRRSALGSDTAMIVHPNRVIAWPRKRLAARPQMQITAPRR